MGDCPTADELFAFAVGRLPAEAREATASHIEECAACLATLHELTDQDDALLCELRKPVPAELFTKDDRPPRSSEVVQGSLGAAGPPALPGYQVLGQLGQGGMGVVWRSHDRRLRRDVAVKVMKAELAGRPQLSRRFLEEAQVASQLAHPAIPPVHELGELPDGRPYFAMKLVKGRTFADLLEARSSPTEDMARLLGIFEQVCQAVAYAHSNGVIHRDLKPQNVMVGAFGEVQVMDWGLAKVLATQPAAVAVTDQRDSIVETERTAHADGATQAGSVLGTYAYMAPEQARGEVERLDRRCDVFGLGAMLCEVLTGQPPYVGTAAEVKAQAEVGHLTAARERLAACGADPELVELAGRCLSAQPEGRPTDAGEVAGTVAAYRAGVQERLRKAELEGASAQARALEERKRRRVQLALATAVLALVAVGAGSGLLVQHYAAGRQAEQARRKAEQRQAVGSALNRAAELRQEARYREATAVLEQARGVLGDVGPGDLRQSLEVAEGELALVKRLDAIRQRHAISVEGHFDNHRTTSDYAVAFREAGLGEVNDDVAVVAARVRASRVFAPLVAALDDWASVAGERRAVSWLLEVARQADLDQWRNRFRNLDVWQNRQALQALADEALRNGADMVGQLSPQVLCTLGWRLGLCGADAVPLLRAAQRRHPGDFWLNLDLGNALYSAKQYEEAAAYFRVAVALRRDAAAAHYNLGDALRARGDLDGAIAEYQEAITLDPKSAPAHNNLGLALHAKGDLDGAIAKLKEAIDLDPKLTPAHYNLGNAWYSQRRYKEAETAFRAAILRKPNYPEAHNNLGNVWYSQGRYKEAEVAYRVAIRFRPEFPRAYNNLGNALHAKGDLDGAIAAYHKAVILDPRYAQAHYNLGNALRDKGNLGRAIAAYRKAIEIAHDHAEAHCNLGHILRDQGRFTEALEELRRGHELGSKRPGWHDRYKSEDWVRGCELLVESDNKLHAVLNGEVEPAGPAERLEFAQVCQRYKRLHAAAAQFYADAFATDATLTADLHLQHRYNAACSAALAAAGQSEDAKHLPDKAVGMLRRQALGWLRDDLALYAKLAEREDPAAKQMVRERMRHWQQDTHLASLRDAAALDRLAHDERATWRQLWADVAALRKKVETAK